MCHAWWNKYFSNVLHAALLFLMNPTNIELSSERNVKHNKHILHILNYFRHMKHIQFTLFQIKTIVCFFLRKESFVSIQLILFGSG